MKACRDHHVASSITAPQNPSARAAIDQIEEAAWTPIDDTANGEAWVAETDYQGHRLIVRRTTLADAQPGLFPTFRTTPSSPTGTGTPCSSTPISAATRSSRSRSAT